MSMDTEENTVTSQSNTAISAAGALVGNVHSANATTAAAAIDENPSYVEIPDNYQMTGLSFEADSSLAYSSVIAPFDDDKIESTSNMCDDNAMSTNENVVDDTNDEDSNAANSSTPNRRVRFKYTKLQLRRFEDHFRMNMFPDSIVREEISKELNIPVRNVQVWFKNRRAKHRKSAQMDSSNSSSYLENSTILPTPDRNSSYHSATNNYSFNGSISQHFNPQSGSYFMANHPTFQPSSSSNSGGCMPSTGAAGSYVLNNHHFSGILGIPSTNNASINHHHPAAPLGTVPSNAPTANNLLHFQQYRTSQMVPPSSQFYKNESSNAMNAASSTYGSTNVGTSTRSAPLGNNPFLINVPTSSLPYPQQHQQHQQHFQTPSMVHFNPSLSNQRQMFYHSGAHHPSSTTVHSGSMSSQNENVPLCSSSVKSEHSIHDSKENLRLGGDSNSKKPSKPATVPEYLHENYLNR